jgi:hypothetical protein
VRTQQGITRGELSRDQLCEALQNDIGVSPSCVEEWARSGALEDSFAPPSAPKPPPLTGRPPSRRER